MTWTIRVLNWKDFQHYKKREPPWIKLHRKLFAKTGWRRLHGSAAKLLVDLWMLAAGNEEGELSATVSDLAYDVRLPEADVLADVEVLATFGFLEVNREALAPALASVLASPPLRRGEAEAEQRTLPTGAGPSPDSSKGGDPQLRAYLMGLVRKHLYLGTPPHPDDPGRDIGILRGWAKGGRDVEEIAAAIEGIALLRDHPGIFGDTIWLKPQEPCTVRALQRNTQNGRDIYAQSVEACYRAHNTRGRKTARAATDSPLKAVWAASSQPQEPQ